jgi:deazaflavin-dependent oxidoreductase (nitroreductase family)
VASEPKTKGVIMSDDRVAANATNAWNKTIIDEFHANDGKLGGNFEGATVLLLHTTGAKSGKERVNPMMYMKKNGRIFVFASKAGADTNPDWFHNLVATPSVTVELGTETFAATASPLVEDERTKIYTAHAEQYPGFAEYQAKTSRVIPVVEIVRS